MNHTRRNISLTLLAILLLLFAAGCSSKGVHMPKHRKRRHCDCPTFAIVLPPQPTSLTATYVA